MLDFMEKSLARAREDCCDYNDYNCLHVENQCFA